MPIMTSLLNYYPHLLALSASSPWWVGEDTGYASNRAMMFQQLPTAGLPFHFQAWAEFEGFVYDQKKTGIIDHMDEIRWDIRPSPHLGTLEVRVCDGVSNLRELGAHFGRELFHRLAGLQAVCLAAGERHHGDKRRRGHQAPEVARNRQPDAPRPVPGWSRQARITYPLSLKMRQSQGSRNTDPGFQHAYGERKVNRGQSKVRGPCQY